MSDALEAREVLRGVRQVLIELRMLSEAPAGFAPDEADKVAHGGFESRPPPGSGGGRAATALLDRHVALLEEWRIRATFELDRHRYRPPAREP